MIIVGAGLAGLMAGHVFPNAPIFEASPEPPLGHKALLRFRSDVVSKLTGIEFRKVRVRKGIWFRGEFVEPNILLANLYSRKCLGQLEGERSIWNVEPVDRYVAPDDFYQQMFTSLGSRIHLGTSVDLGDHSTRQKFVWTAPMHIALHQLKIGFAGMTFRRRSINVIRARVPDCDVHQTIYFPDPELNLYRASITGDTLIAEFRGEVPAFHEFGKMLMDIFGLDSICEPVENVRQSYGKIAPVDEKLRRAAIVKMTTKHGVYSVGRFATWRNILLDDVVNDLAVVKRLIHATDYDHHLHGI